MNTRVRKALASDLGTLIDISRRTINACYRPFLAAATLDAFLDSGAADRYVEENVGRCSVILLDGKLVGYAVFLDNMIDLMMIDHAAHRQGLGTELLGHVEAMLFQRYGELTLETFEDNANANAFYRRNGWLEMSKHFDVDSGVNKIVFRKSA